MVSVWLFSSDYRGDYFAVAWNIQYDGDIVESGWSALELSVAEHVVHETLEGVRLLDVLFVQWIHLQNKVYNYQLPALLGRLSYWRPWKLFDNDYNMEEDYFIKIMQNHQSNSDHWVDLLGWVGFYVTISYIKLQNNWGESHCR